MASTTIVLGVEPGETRPRRLRAVGPLVVAALLIAVALGGRTGAVSPVQLAERFAAALDTGDADDVAALLADDPTIVTWTPALPRGQNSATMALIDLGRADRVVVAEAYPLADYQGYYQALANRTELLGCRSQPTRGAVQRALYDVWIECRFRSTNQLFDSVSRRRAVLGGQVQFGMTDGKVRAVLIRAEPTRSLDAVWEFMKWIRETHPAEFEHWMRGRFQDPVMSAESGAVLLELASEYSASAGV